MQFPGVLVLAASLPCCLPGAAPEFGAPQPVSSVENASRARLQRSLNGDLHLTFIVHDGIAGAEVKSGSLYYARLREGRWSTPLRIAGPGPEAVPNHYAGVAGDTAGNGYVVYINAARSRLYFISVRNAVEVRAESRNVRRAVSAEVEVDSNNVVRVVYRDKGPEENLLLSRAAGSAGWDSTIPVPAHGLNAFGQRQFGLATSAEGRLYYAYRYRSEETPNGLALRVFKGNSWSPEVTRFASSAGTKVWWPQMALDGKGGLHIVWYSTRSGGSRLHYREPGGTVHAIGEGFGEFAHPPGLAVGAGGDVVIVRSRDHDLRSPVARNGADLLVFSKGQVRSHVELKHPAGAAGWANVASTRAGIVLVWIAGGRVFWQFAADR